MEDDGIVIVFYTGYLTSVGRLSLFIALCGNAEFRGYIAVYYILKLEMAC